MEYIAIAKNIKISPRKMRLVVDGVKAKKLRVALSELMVMNKRASGPVEKAIKSAVANAKNNFQAMEADLAIKDIMITEGVTAKRYHFAGRGRSRPYQRRTSHITVILADNKVKSSTKVETKEPAQIASGSKEAKTGGKK